MGGGRSGAAPGAAVGQGDWLAQDRVLRLMVEAPIVASPDIRRFSSSVTWLTTATPPANRCRASPRWPYSKGNLCLGSSKRARQRASSVAVSLPRLRHDGHHRPGRRSRRPWLAPAFRLSGVARLALHPPYQPGRLPKSASRVCPMGIELFLPPSTAPHASSQEDGRR